MCVAVASISVHTVASSTPIVAIELILGTIGRVENANLLEAPPGFEGTARTVKAALLDRSPPHRRAILALLAEVPGGGVIHRNAIAFHFNISNGYGFDVTLPSHEVAAQFHAARNADKSF